MKFTFLGTGTSFGVPVIGCQCEVCRSSDPRDRRMRTAAMIETDTSRMLIDCGPDIRQQLIPQPFRPINGVVITHSHYDHVGGLDDLRPFTKLASVPLYANDKSCRELRQHMSYCFADHLYPGVPKFSLNTIAPGDEFLVGDIEVKAFEVMHGALPILGYRVGNLAYITDMKTLPDATMQALQGIDTLIVSALRWEKPIHSHQLVDDALRLVDTLQPRRTFFIHMTHEVGLIDEANARLPKGVRFAYDGMCFDF